MSAPTLPEQGSITMYTTTWCGYCKILKKGLQREGITWNEVNIEEVPGAAEYVQSVNGGNQTVPTVVFPDGSSATNPSLAEVKARLS
ncbi:mycoredoxin [Quadrisphaera granulorum]|uniref:Mycoredoxin n=1 Tax=Quadrisphaera granulorum TaxID=317664 RepID=A0A316AH24_9ACTN|nr:mycoredoxin [Quadrisphaera granulorum]PWJ56240.1 mycoredoxin [Quadrisphaera granulorum]SZE94874.1 mycoredoxin [Quadrisphaera granulorum]